MSLGEPNNGHWYSGMENFINRPTPTQLKDKDLLKKILLADTTKFMVIHRNAGKRQRLEVLYNENRVKWVSRKYLNDQLHLAINDTEQTTGGGLVLLIGSGNNNNNNNNNNDNNNEVWYLAVESTKTIKEGLVANDKFISGRELNNYAFDQSEVASCGFVMALMKWHQGAKFSGKSGKPTKSIQGGSRREAPGRGDRLYPRVDPAVIMAVLSPDNDKCLLGQYAGGSFFTCLAGFVEQGESVEEACRRETMEESGIRVGKVLLHSTQPWPIGRAGACELMIGCMAHAISTDINVDTDEIGDAKWFTRDQVKQMIERTDAGNAKPSKELPLIPGKNAMAYHLLRCFAEGFTFNNFKL